MGHLTDPTGSLPGVLDTLWDSREEHVGLHKTYYGVLRGGTNAGKGRDITGLGKSKYGKIKG